MNIKNIVNEEILNLMEVYGQNQDPMDLLGLTMMIGRMYPENLKQDSEEAQVFMSILQNDYNKKGDRGVIDRFKAFTGIPIKSVGNTKYVFDYSDIDNGQSSSTSWKYKHSGD